VDPAPRPWRSAAGSNVRPAGRGPREGAWACRCLRDAGTGPSAARRARPNARRTRSPCAVRSRRPRSAVTAHTLLVGFSRGRDRLHSSCTWVPGSRNHGLFVIPNARRLTRSRCACLQLPCVPSDLKSGGPSRGSWLRIPPSPPTTGASLKNFDGGSIRLCNARERASIGEPVVHAITELLTDYSDLIRMSAACQPGFVGPKATTALPALTAAKEELLARQRRLDGVGRKEHPSGLAASPIQNGPPPLSWFTDRAVQRITAGPQPGVGPTDDRFTCSGTYERPVFAFHGRPALGTHCQT
jgi:hypothetical protein